MLNSPLGGFADTAPNGAKDVAHQTFYQQERRCKTQRVELGDEPQANKRP